MATTEERIDEFAFEVGTDVKSILAAIGILASLDTVAKTNLVTAINEVLAAAEAAAGGGVSEIQMNTAISNAIADLKGTAPGILDTLGEISDALGDSATVVADLTALINAKQAGDDTLTAISTVATAANRMIYFTGTDTAAATDLTALGRQLMGVANTAALMALLGAASETAAGIAEVATTAEVNTGSDDTRFVTPAKLAARLTALLGNTDATPRATYIAARDS